MAKKILKKTRKLNRRTERCARGSVKIKVGEGWRAKRGECYQAGKDCNGNTYFIFRNNSKPILHMWPDLVGKNQSMIQIIKTVFGSGPELN